MTIRHPRFRPARSLAALAIVATIASLAACSTPSGSPAASPGGTPGAPASPSSGPSTSPSQPVGTPPASSGSVRVYFMLGSHTGNAGLVPVLRSLLPNQVDTVGAMAALLAGPNAEELAADPAMYTDVPAGTTTVGLTIDAGIATVDLSTGFAVGGTAATKAQRYGQVVLTLTQFPAVHAVRFKLDGAPAPALLPGPMGTTVTRAVTRADYAALLPAIWVDDPAWGAALPSGSHVTGTANVFEARFRLVILDAGGKTIAAMPVSAACGTGCRGAFDVTVTYTVSAAQRGTLRVFEPSAKDGSPTHVVDYPVSLTP